jgi:DNA-binding NtrC family response regulator
MNRTPKILVVDDEEIVRRSYRRLLDEARYSAQTAADGSAALDAMQREPFDVVLLDLRLPGGDGMGVLRSIRERWPAAEVVIITGNPTLETAKEAVRLGAYDYLAKPVDPDRILKVARSAAEHKGWALRPLHHDSIERSMS